MTPLSGVSPALIARARVDQVATIYASWSRTTASMLLGAALLTVAMWSVVPLALLFGWFALVLVNQFWRWRLTVAWSRARPGADAAARWGRYWACGSAAAGALWGLAAVTMFPESEAHQALLIVCLFGVVLGGLNLTAVWRPSFYGFVLPALVPLILRVAWEADAVHLYIAFVMTVVLGFVIAFGHRVNDILTHALATRYENVDLIAELKGQTRAAIEARAAAETANRAKSQLLVAASHDLRQPLHAVGLFVGALAARIAEPEPRSLISRIQQALEALEAQFGQLIDLSKLEAGVLVADRARVPLGPLFAEIAGEFAPMAEAKGLRLAAVGTRLAVDSDPALLSRILRNLVGNAVRYTRAGGVVLGARRRGTNVVIDVVDSGVGIAAEHRERIFEEFFQIRSSASSSQAARGMGLGLAIVRRFCNLLGHDIVLDSRTGRGSRFSVTAPRVTDLRAPLPHESASRARRSDGINGMLSGAIVAVIDDDVAAVDAMRALFSTWGATVAGGCSVDETLADLGRIERYPDLIVADLRLDADGSGLDAVVTLRQELGFRVPALVVSGDTSFAAAHAVRSAGLVLLRKPVVPGALAAAAAALLASTSPANLRSVA
ncbi:MAG TPA: ATP-binding protein [Casimicrobiaceae bacterium]|nr:ATP-binding protein [Casimicrobiaceae bacterium]